MREVKICPQCQTENRAEARFCSRCGRSLAAITPVLAAGSGSTPPQPTPPVSPTPPPAQPAADRPSQRPEIDAVRWQPRPGEIAARIQHRDMAKGQNATLIIEDNTLAVIVRDGLVVGQQGPGRYQLQTLAEPFLAFGRQPEVSAVLIDSGELSLEFALNDLWTIDPLRLGATCRLAVQVSDAQRFIRNVLKEQATITVDDLRRLLFPELYDAAAVYVGDHSMEQLEAERKNRRDDFGVDVQERMAPLFEQSGVTFQRVQMLDLRHPRMNALRGQEEELFLGPAEFDIQQRLAAHAYERQQAGLEADQRQRELEVQRLRQEFAQRQRLSEVTTAEESHKIALEETAAAQHEQRSRVWDRMRRAIQQDKLNERTTQEEWDTFVGAADRRKLLREDELQQLRDGLRWSEEDRQKERAQLIAMADLQSQYERKAAELSEKLKHDRATLQAELATQRETILGRLGVRTDEIEAQMRVEDAERQRQARAEQAQREAAAKAAEQTRTEQEKSTDFQRQQEAKAAEAKRDADAKAAAARRQDERFDYDHSAGIEDDAAKRARQQRTADTETDINIGRQKATADNATVRDQAQTAADIRRMQHEREMAEDAADLDLAAKALAMMKENQAAKQRMQRDDEEERRRIARQDELARQEAALAAEKERLQNAIAAEKERQMMELQRQTHEQQHELARMKAMGELSAEALIALAPVPQAQILAELKRTEQLKNLSEEQILAMAAERNPAVVELLKAKVDAAAEGKLHAAEAARWQALAEERTRHEAELRQQIETQQAAQIKLVQEAAARETQAAREAIERTERMANTSAERAERMASESALRQAQSGSEALRAVADVARSFAQNQAAPAAGPTVILPPAGAAPGSGPTVIGAAPASGGTAASANPPGGGEVQACPKCRVKMPVGEKFCSNCGHQFYD